MKRLMMVCSVLAVAACAQQPSPPPVAAAPPPPPPPPPPPTTFTVYFNDNSSQLDPGAREILRFAANAYKSGAPGGVQVTGYADPAGSPGYNQRLSLQRARAVAGELTKDGVPRDALAVSGAGETTTGSTPDRDRRVEVVFGGGPPSS
jgi:OmpA-OmpF porin, OOP family